MLDKKETEQLRQFFHDISNDLVLLRAAAGSIKKHTDSPNMIATKLDTIETALKRAYRHLEDAQSQLLPN